MTIGVIVVVVAALRPTAIIAKSALANKPVKLLSLQKIR
jgi:hypothetical protein